MGYDGVDFLGGLVVESSREGISNAVAFVGGVANGECELGKEVEPSSLAWDDVFLGEDGRNDGVVSTDGEVLPVEVRAPDCEGVNHGEEFLLVGGVIHLRGKELLACEGDGVFVGWGRGVSGQVLDGGGLGGAAGEMLGQYSSNGEVGGITGDIEMASGVDALEDRGHGDGLVEEVESMLEAIVPIEGLVLACEFVERRRQCGQGIRRSKRQTYICCAWRRILLSEDREDLANVLKVGLEGGAKDEDVIKVQDDTDFEEVTEDVVHGGLECGGGIGESERHYEELVVPEPRAECGLVGVLLADTDLVEATAEVDLGEIFGSTAAIKKFRYPGEWVLVLDRDPVQGTIVCAHAKFQGTILLDEETTGSEGGGARFKESFFKEFIELALHFFGLGDGELLRRAARRRMVGLEINGVGYISIGRGRRRSRGTILAFHPHKVGHLEVLNGELGGVETGSVEVVIGGGWSGVVRGDVMEDAGAGGSGRGPVMGVESIAVKHAREAVGKGHVGFVGEGGCKIFVAYSLDAGDEHKVGNDGGGEVMAEGANVLEEAVGGTGLAEVTKLFEVVVDGFLGVEGGSEKVGPLEEGVTRSSRGAAVAYFGHPPFGGIAEEVGGGNGKPVDKGHVVELERVLELGKEEENVLVGKAREGHDVGGSEGTGDFPFAGNDPGEGVEVEVIGGSAVAGVIKLAVVVKEVVGGKLWHCGVNLGGYLGTASDAEKPYLQALLDNAIKREEESERERKEAFLEAQEAILQIVPSLSKEQCGEQLQTILTAIIQVRSLEDHTSQIAEVFDKLKKLQEDLADMTSKYHDLTVEIAELRQAQVTNPLPLPPDFGAAITTNLAPLTVSSSTSSSSVMATPSGPAASANSAAVVISSEAGNSAIAAAPRSEVVVAGPYVDRKAVQMPSKYDGKEDIGSMRAYF
ncbi:hypothetical protein CBR_g46882 [Chara braunii]|uniref:Uncharacterized protein n=1 Tax=Chara braunii TaxID=69332 RepID=A0A388M1D4_CHABU|nr:hypothetical protein CBR_g46882 [Chara braunii]|eukprot:GBG88315.1 hypothetical protein CBR_g46882 [Chara braunii]